MGLIAFCGFVLPWGALALWLFFTQIKPYHTGVPWRPLTDYVAPDDAARGELVAPAGPGFREGAPDAAPPVRAVDLIDRGTGSLH